jgi:hypothetical protein
MAHNGRDTKIRNLNLKIKEAQKLIPPARDLMVENNYSLISIKKYNRTVSDVLLLKEQLEHMMKYNKPQQYMEEAIVPSKYLY